MILVLSECTVRPAEGEERIVFDRDIAPILATHCYSCHGPDSAEQESDLRLDQLDDSIVRSDPEVTVINPGSVQRSALFLRISSDDPEIRMPPVSDSPKLPKTHIETIHTWIEQGARHSRHWAFVAPQRPALPTVDDVAWPESPIDHFILRKLESERLAPSPTADRYALIRRVSLDLTGVPPTSPEIEGFLSDETPGNWDRLIDRLLGSPRYGECMSLPWLDAARYADTTGHAADKPRTMWLFRDWVIDALNSDMPFDQFTVEQLAGDMLPNATEQQRIATGFHRNSIQALGNNPRKEEFRVKGIIDRLETTGKTWLGLTVACAECHDHKYDPVSQREYYELFAIFNNVPHVGERFEVHGPQIQVLPADTRAWIARLRQELSELGGGVPEGSASGDERRRALMSRIEELESCTVTAQVMDELEEPRDTFIHIRGNFENRGERVRPAIPIVTSGRLPVDQPVNRLTFARSIVARTNPLTARVTVNRIWKHHFGNGLTNTVDDFGVRGEYPSHPALLDWLAVEFMESGWDVKHIHRLIVSSATYQQSSDSNARLNRLDSQNRLLARGPRLRLHAEQVRDVALFASGMVTNQIGGPSVYPPQPPTTGQFRDGTAGQWVNSSGAEQYRRSIYTFWQRMSPYPSMVLFDAPSRERCTVNRPATNTPLQALATLNDPHFVDLARHFGRRIRRAAGSDTDRIRLAFLTSLSRPPELGELDAFVRMVEGSTEDAIWFRVAQVLLNLDEALTKE
jgi:hypothetical protein